MSSSVAVRGYWAARLGLVQLSWLVVNPAGEKPRRSEDRHVWQTRSRVTKGFSNPRQSLVQSPSLDSKRNS
eukprot:2067814-Rhodomonas_salina.2